MIKDVIMRKSIEQGQGPFDGRFVETSYVFRHTACPLSMIERTDNTYPARLLFRAESSQASHILLDSVRAIVDQPIDSGS
jgi:hypothetical protein